MIDYFENVDQRWTVEIKKIKYDSFEWWKNNIENTMYDGEYVQIPIEVPEFQIHIKNYILFLNALIKSNNFPLKELAKHLLNKAKYLQKESKQIKLQ